VDQWSCAAIAKFLDRDPKTVWAWLKKCGIPIRPRGGDPASVKGHGNLAVSHTIGHKLSKESKEKIRQSRIKDGRLPCMINGVHWLHVYGKERHPRWKGGITPERQKFYATREWQSVARKVWKRDQRTCQRCGKKHDEGIPFDIHHVVSFEHATLRCELSNLVLLCEVCHYWVHGPNNTEGSYLKPCP